MACNSTITNAEVLALLFVIAPQFATTDPVKLAGYNLLIDALRCMINERALACCTALAFANLLAHYLTLQGNAILGVTNSISEGQLSISMANSINAGFFSSTPYGQAYEQLTKNFTVGAYVTNSRGGFYGPTCCGAGYGYGFR